MVNKRWYRLLILLLILLWLWSRLSRVSSLGYFMIDEERDAFLVKRILVAHRPLLVGGVIPGGINVGPFFFYLSAIPYAISRLNPIGPAYAAGIIGVIGVIVVCAVGKKMFGTKVGLLAMVFSTFSILNIIYQRPWWPLTMSQLVTLMVYMSLFELTHYDDSSHHSKWWLILIGMLVVGVQSDPSTLSLIPLSIFWMWRHREKIRLDMKNVFWGVGLFLLAHISWLIFEFRHDFISSRAIISLLGGEKSGGFSMDGPITVFKSLAGLLYRLFFITGPLDVTKQINPAEVFLNQRLNSIWWSGAVFLLLILGIWVIWGILGRNLAKKIVSLHFAVALIGILIYTSLFPGYVYEWLWQFMFPVFFLIFADILVRLGGKRMWVIWGILGFWGIWQISLFTKLENSTGLGNKLKVVEEVQKSIAGRPYELRSEGELRYGGWRYLFTLYGHPPVKSYMDYVYTGWVYPNSEENPELSVIINNPADNISDFSLEKSIDEWSDD